MARQVAIDRPGRRATATRPAARPREATGASGADGALRRRRTGGGRWAAAQEAAACGGAGTPAVTAPGRERRTRLRQRDGATGAGGRERRGRPVRARRPRPGQGDEREPCVRAPPAAAGSRQSPGAAAASAPAASRGRARRRRAAEPPLEVPHPGEQLVEREQRRPARQADERHLERHSRLAAPHDLVEGAREALKEPREIVDLGAGRQLDDVADLLVGQIEQLAQRGTRRRRPRACAVRERRRPWRRRGCAGGCSTSRATCGRSNPCCASRSTTPRHAAASPADERRRQLVEDLAVGHAEHARHVVRP